MFHRSFLKNQYNDAKNIPYQFFLSDDEAKKIDSKLDSKNIEAFIKSVSDNKNEVSSKVKEIAQTFFEIKYFIREFDEINKGYAEFEKACSRYDNMVERYRRILKNIPENWDPVCQQYSHGNSLAYTQTIQEFCEMKDQMWPPKVWGYETCNTLRDKENPRNAKITLSELWDKITPRSAETVRRDRLNQLYLKLPTLIKDVNNIVSLLEKNDEILRAFPEQTYLVKVACHEIREVALQFIKNVKDNNLSETRHFRRMLY